MGSKSRNTMIGCALASLLLAPRLLLAGLPVADGEIRTNFDLADKFNANGWISIAGQPPSPNPLAPTSSPVTVDGDGAKWEFGKVTLHAKGGLDHLVAKQVSLELVGDHEHKVNPHTGAAERNPLPSIESLTRDVELGKTNKYWAWGKKDHRHPPGMGHPDWYMVGGTVSYSKGGVINTLATNDAFVAAYHQLDQPADWPEEPQGGLTVDTNVRFDAELGLLTIMSANVSGGVTSGDPLATARMHEMNFHYAGPLVPEKWLFREGHFALETLAGEIAIEGELDMHVYDVDWGDSGGVLDRGGAVDGSDGASPWMNQLDAVLRGEADTGIAGTTFGPLAISLNPEVNLAHVTNGFTMSSPWIPMEVTLGPSLVQLEEHGLSGDSNGDGSVDAADYVGLRKIGMTPEGHTAWRTNFGETAGLGSPLASPAHNVPEPAGALLLILGAATLRTCWRRRSG